MTKQSFNRELKHFKHKNPIRDLGRIFTTAPHSFVDPHIDRVLCRQLALGVRPAQHHLPLLRPPGDEGAGGAQGGGEGAVHHLQREQGGVRHLQDQSERPQGGGGL